MSELVFDLSKEGLLRIMRPYQSEIMRFLWAIKKPVGSRIVYNHLQALGGDTAKCRASIINFLNRMVNEGFLEYVEEAGKGGFHRIYRLNETSKTEQIFRDAVYEMVHEKLSVFRAGEAEG